MPLHALAGVMMNWMVPICQYWWLTAPMESISCLMDGSNFDGGIGGRNNENTTYRSPGAQEIRCRDTARVARSRLCSPSELAGPSLGSNPRCRGGWPDAGGVGIAYVLGCERASGQSDDLRPRGRSRTRSPRHWCAPGSIRRRHRASPRMHPGRRGAGPRKLGRGSLLERPRLRRSRCRPTQGTQAFRALEMRVRRCLELIGRSEAEPEVLCGNLD
jgi:hypothetical protein